MPGKVYQLQQSENLQAATWIDVGEPALGDGDMVCDRVEVSVGSLDIPPTLFWRVTVADVTGDGRSDLVVSGPSDAPGVTVHYSGGGTP